MFIAVTSRPNTTNLLLFIGSIILLVMYDDEKLALVKSWLGTGSINIFGRPFAGKDVQGEILAELLDGNMLGGGEILRGNVVPEHIKECLRVGKLIPSEDYVNIVLPYLSQSKLVGKPLILSSVGRWHGEEMGVIKAIKESGHPLKSVIYLNISDDDSYTRWLKLADINDRHGRRDDTEEILRTRFAEFQEKTMPVIDFYRKLELLIEIDGSGTREQVTNSIINSISKHCK